MQHEVTQMFLSVFKSLIAYPRSTAVFLAAVLILAAIGVVMEQKLGDLERALLVISYLAMAIFLKLAIMLGVRVAIKKQHFVHGDFSYVGFMFALIIAALILAVPALQQLSE